MEKPLRMLMLLSGSRSYSRREIAKRFAISERTVYRYINSIENSGFILDRTGGRYRLVRNQASINTVKNLLHFSEEEAYILFRSLALLDNTSKEANRLIKKLHTLYDFKALSKIHNTDELEKVTTLGESIQNKKQVILYRYRSSNTGTISDRQVEPFSFMEDYQAIWCFDPEDRINKQFKIARIDQVKIMEQDWQYSSSHKIPYSDAFRMSAAEVLTTVEVILTLKACNLLVEEHPLAEKHITKEDERYHLKIPVADFHGIGRFILGLPGESEVCGPPEFIEFLKNMSQKDIFRMS